MYLSDIHTHSIAKWPRNHLYDFLIWPKASRKRAEVAPESQTTVLERWPLELLSYFRSLTYAPKKRFGIELLFEWN